MKSIKTQIFYCTSNYRLLVGAPLAHTDQPDVERGGAVYKCNIDTADACQQIAFDRSGTIRPVPDGILIELGHLGVQAPDKL